MDGQPPLVDTGLSFEQYFHAHYDRIVEWALVVTKNDHAIHRDIVHDVYVRLSGTTVRPESLANPNGYLFTVLRNAHLSKVKRATRMREVSLDSEFSGEGLQRDPRKLMAIREELEAICRYACLRKATSSSASILILRYFHGYYTAETARIVNRSRNSVESRMSRARAEFIAYLKEPVIQRANGTISTIRSVRPGHDLLADLRSEIFSQKSGVCPPSAHWKTLYRRNLGLSCDELSHVVSCRVCLDSINRLLKMPLLAERHPLDTRGPQSVVEVIRKNQGAAVRVVPFVMLLNDLITQLSWVGETFS